jgi:hypothetical protein
MRNLHKGGYSYYLNTLIFKVFLVLGDDSVNGTLGDSEGLLDLHTTKDCPLRERSEMVHQLSFDFAHG